MTSMLLPGPHRFITSNSGIFFHAVCTIEHTRLQNLGSFARIDAPALIGRSSSRCVSSALCRQHRAAVFLEIRSALRITPHLVFREPRRRCKKDDEPGGDDVLAAGDGLACQSCQPRAKGPSSGGLVE